MKELIAEGESELFDIDQLIAVGDFEVFKAEMAYQNKMREMAALNEMDCSDEENYDAMRLKLEYEQLEESLNLQIAVHLSLDDPGKKVARRA